MAYSEAQKRATKKYQEKNYYSSRFIFPKELEIIIKQAADKSVNSFIQQAVCEKLESMGYELPESCKKN